ncbi:MAG: phosphoglucomutase/phosphomannomutase family protein [Lachnospiraceae bacterium]|nr:phosphoglucomutase/phosphomannomutase family protein [Lachnospiraceae bacterium]
MIKFGTGGWRAVIGDEFIKSNIQILARAMVEKMKNEGKDKDGIVMGYDRRFLSKEAMQWAGVVFAAEGITAYLVNSSAPTPLVMYYVKEHKLPYGLMITASHNPAVYNGIKVFTEGGRDADEHQTADIERYIRMFESADSDKSGEFGNDSKVIREMDYAEAVKKGLIKEIYPLNDYIDYVLEAVDVKAIRDARLRVAIDPMYGVSETSLMTILHTARCEVFPIHNTHDTLFGSNLPAPTKATLRPLQNHVVDKGCDIGIATDGDADRIGVVDDTGRFLHPNDILVLLYYYMVKYKHEEGPVVRNLATTHMLDKVAATFGQKCYEVPVGFKWISAKMTETNAVIGGESSGGLTVRGHISGKDGIYAAALLVEMIAKTGRKLSEIMKDIEEECGSIFMEERDYRFPAARKPELVKTLYEDKKLPELPFEIDHVSYMDGSKVYFKNGGWVIARFSGTEPLLRIFCEMPDEEDARKVCKIYEEWLDL